MVTQTIGICLYLHRVFVMDSVNSTTFIKRPPFMTEAQECILYTKEILVGQLFLGLYQERRYVPVLNEYRDVVVINSVEKDLLSEINKVLKKWLSVREIKWVGITGPDTHNAPEAYCFWVKLSNLPFGNHWFQINNVKLRGNEILLNLKCIRKSQPSDIVFFSHQSQSSIGTNKNETPVSSSAENSSLDRYNWDFDMKEAFSKFCQTCTGGLHAVKPMITWENFLTILKSGFTLIIALILASISGIHFLGEYFLRLISEVTKLINAFSPIIVQLIDFFTKIVGGIFILIAGMFRSPVPRVYQEPQRTYPVRSIPYSNLTETPEQNVDWRVRNRILRQELLSDRW